jgi:hypothetical protein
MPWAKPHPTIRSPLFVFDYATFRQLRGHIVRAKIEKRSKAAQIFRGNIKRLDLL